MLVSKKEVFFFIIAGTQEPLVYILYILKCLCVEKVGEETASDFPKVKMIG